MIQPAVIDGDQAIMSTPTFVLSLRQLLLAVAASWCACVQAETLAEVLSQTLESNPEVRIDAARRMAVDEALSQARGGYFPKIDINYGKGRERRDNRTIKDEIAAQGDSGTSLGQQRYDRLLTLNQMLFDGFATSSEVSRNEARLASAAHKLAATSEQIALKAAEAYLEVLRLQEIIILTRQNLEVHERTYDQIKLRASSGVGRKSDLDQIEARLALSRANLTAAEANLQVANINYKLVVGVMPVSLVRPAAPDIGLLPKNADDAVVQSLANNRILKSASADVDAAQAQHRGAKAALSPRLDLELGAQRNDLQNKYHTYPTDDNTYAMLRLRYNLFKGGADLARIGETKHLTYEAQEIRNRAERQLEQSVRLSWNAYVSARDRLPNLGQHASSSLLTREAYTKQFAIGQRTLIDLLDSENEYYTASVNYVNGQYVELFSRYRILADIGQLIQSLGVSHREETFLSAN